ncbi:MAG: dihydroorotase [Eubacterium sp.]|nr:dihydroorotase [Eubacterium sp.]
MTLLIKNGIVVDPVSKTETCQDIFIENERIAKMGEGLDLQADQVIDAAGNYVMPGFVDLHVHLRDPCLTYKEDIATGTAAAAAGGFTTIVAMPNTKPVSDSPEVIQYVTEKAKEVSRVNVYQVGSVTVGMAGQEMSDIEGMYEAGCIAISEDGKSVMNAQLYKEAMAVAAKNDMIVLAHCEDINMVNGGVLNADAHTSGLGFKGITNAVEDVIVARDIVLAKETGARLHLCHCSTKDSVEMVRLAKEAGLPVSAEVCPHHFTSCSEDITGDDANFKMNPPLRTREDMEALREGLAKGILDVIATDHAPHSAEEKAQSITKAPFGIVGLETALALSYSELVKTGLISMADMAAKLSYNPAKILGIDRGVLAEGKVADLVIVNTTEEYAIDVDKFLSKGKNTPYHGRKVYGKVLMTVIGGEVAYENK